MAHGGRGSAKSWGFAGLAVTLGAQRPLRILGVREVQNSIQESVHKLLSDQIERLGLSRYYDVQATGIYGKNGTEIIYAGIRTDPRKIKSTEGIDICLVEEAETVSETSWKILIPTIRKEGSEIWVAFNPRDEKDATHERFITKPPPSARVVEINFDDNPWFPAVLEEERQYALSLILNATDDEDREQAQADYDHIWLGKTQRAAHAAIFNKRVVIHDFDEPPEKTRLHYGADWGFANDPTALVRFWIIDDELWISHEAYGYRTETDLLPDLFDKVPGARTWPIKADCARPETISYVRRKGFNINPAEKWPGSVEDGIAHIRAFKKIHIHTRCKKLQEEARMYKYKVDKITGEVLPIVVDKWNHGWDAIRYGLDGYIQRRGALAQWAKLGK